MSRGRPLAGRIRLLVSDVDGTLVRDDKSLPDANRDAILALTASGVELGNPIEIKGNRLIFFTDCDGNLIHLIHRENPLP